MDPTEINTAVFTYIFTRIFQCKSHGVSAPCVYGSFGFVPFYNDRSLSTWRTEARERWFESCVINLAKGKKGASYHTTQSLCQTILPRPHYHRQEFSYTRTSFLGKRANGSPIMTHSIQMPTCDTLILRGNVLPRAITRKNAPGSATH